MGYVGNFPAVGIISSANLADKAVTAPKIDDSASQLFGFRNRIINGDMRIDQRNAGAVVTATGGQFAVDRFRGANQTDGTLTLQQSTTAPAGFTNSIVATVTATDTSLGGTQYAQIEQRIEGNNVADLGWGTVNAQTVTLSFWVRSSLTGTFCAALYNSNGTRSYVATYTINSANTFEYKTITVPGDTGGTWQTGTSTGIDVIFCLAVGSTYQQAAGSWGTTAFAIGTSAQTNFLGTNGATFYITGVQLEKGSVATPFEFRSIGQELALCQRYYYRIKGSDTASDTGAFGSGFSINTTIGRATIPFPTTMRVAPSALDQSGTASHYRFVAGAAGSIVCSAVPTFNSSSVVMGDVAWTVASGAIANQGGNFMSNNAASYLGWSAEL